MNIKKFSKDEIIIIILIYFFVVAIGLLGASIVHSDEIILKNRNVLHGNIISVNKKNKTLILDIVIEGNLVGIKITLKEKEINTIIIDDIYRSLIRKGVSPKLRKINLETYKYRIEQSYRMNDRAWTRVNRQKDRVFKQRNKDADRLHSREMEVLRHRNRKELITHSKDTLVTPVVKIEDKPQYNRDIILNDLDEDYEGE